MFEHTLGLEIVDERAAVCRDSTLLVSSDTTPKTLVRFGIQSGIDLHVCIMSDWAGLGRPCPVFEPQVPTMPLIR